MTCRGIYALERLARDSPRDHPLIIEVLTAYVRRNVSEPCPPAGEAGVEERSIVTTDVQATLTVLRRRNPANDVQTVSI